MWRVGKSVAGIARVAVDVDRVAAGRRADRERAVFSRVPSLLRRLRHVGVELEADPSVALLGRQTVEQIESRPERLVYGIRSESCSRSNWRRHAK